MDDDLHILSDALKNGITEDDVRHAWLYGKQYPYRPDRRVYLRIGPDRNGRTLEVLGEFQLDGWLIFHALTPPTKKMLELTRRRR